MAFPVASVSVSRVMRPVRCGDLQAQDVMKQVIGLLGAQRSNVNASTFPTKIKRSPRGVAAWLGAREVW